ncbi:MAG: hypothetical protein KAG10_04145 [Methylococcales bacterium]|nr:hypothetical protein [Methylococcales bacterium]
MINSCASAPDLKVKFNPLMPVPFLIVPDDGSENNTHNNVNIYQERDRQFESEQWK